MNESRGNVQFKFLPFYLVEGTFLIFCLEGVTGKQLPAKLPQEKRRARRKRESGGRKEDLQQNILSVEVETQFMQVVHSDVVFWTNHR